MKLFKDFKLKDTTQLKLIVMAGMFFAVAISLI
jgi:hypothetical protein